MDKNNKELIREKEIDVNFRDLFLRIVYSWRFIILTSILFAFIFAGFKYYTITKENLFQNKQSTLSQQELKSFLTGDELFEIESALNLEKQINQRFNYQNNSILMKMDAYNKNTVVLQYYIDSHYSLNLNSDISKNYVEDLINNYQILIDGNDIKKYDTSITNDTKKIYELVSFNYTPTKTDQVNGVNSSFTIVVSGKDIDKANILADVIVKSMKDYQKLLSKKVIEHDLVLIKKYDKIDIDYALAERQKSITTEIIDLQTKLNNLKLEFTQVQNQIFDFNSDSDHKTNTINQKINLFQFKYCVAGFMIGCFLSLILVITNYVTNNTLKTSSELEKMYCLNNLGDVSLKYERKKIFSSLDNILDRVFRNSIEDFDKQLDIICTKICIICKRKCIGELFISTSLILSDIEKSFLHELSFLLNKENINIELVDNILGNVASMKQICKANNIIMLEKASFTTYSDIEQEFNILSEQNADIIGLILLKEF